METTQTEKGESFVDAKPILPKSYRFHQFSVFIITALLYAAFHASRTGWAYSQKSVVIDSYFTDTELGVLNTVYMLAYAFGLFYSGWLGDKSHLKSFIAKGAFLSVFAFCSFGVLATYGVHNIFLYSMLFILNGMGQSRGFPGCLAILNNWIESSHRGLLIGLWDSCVNLGNIMGQQIGRLVIDIYHLPWSITLFLIGGCMIVMTLIMLVFLRVQPKDAHVSAIQQVLVLNETEVPVKPEIKVDLHVEPAPVTERTKSIGFWAAWKTPNILRYAIIYACIKGSAYGLLFWLPNYVQTVLGFGNDSATITAMYDLGQVTGAIVLGFCSDKIAKKSLIVVTGLYLSSIIFIFMTTLKAGCSVWVFGFSLFFTGLLFGGPGFIIGSIVSSELGATESLKNNSRALSTIVGIIDGTGAVGASIVQLVIPYLKKDSFYLYFSLCLTAALLSTPLLVKEIRSLRKSVKDLKEVSVEMSSTDDSRQM